jgi:hypothetical protein
MREKKLGSTLLAAVAGLCLSASQTAWADFAAGQKAYDKKDYTQALNEWRPLAEQGDDAAQFNLGLMYAHGLGVKQDDAQAVMWFRKVA